MIKRHLKLFIILLVATVLFNAIGITIFILTSKLMTLYILDALLLIGLLIYSNVYFNKISAKALKKKITKETYYLLREVKSIIWIGIYLHLFLSLVTLFISRFL